MHPPHDVLQETRELIRMLIDPLDPPGSFALAVLHGDLNRVALALTGRRVTPEEFRRVLHHGDVGYEMLLSTWAVTVDTVNLAPLDGLASEVGVSSATLAELIHGYPLVMERRADARARSPFVTDASTAEEE